MKIIDNFFEWLDKWFGYDKDPRNVDEGDITAFAYTPDQPTKRDKVTQRVLADLQALPPDCSVTAKMFPDMNQSSVAKVLKRLASNGYLRIATEKAKYGMTIYVTKETVDNPQTPGAYSNQYVNELTTRINNS